APSNEPLAMNTTDLTVDGADIVGISGANTGANGTRIFNVATGATLTLKNILLERAYSANGDGGAVASTGALTANNVRFTDNATSPSWSGSAILCWRPLTITNCEIVYNIDGVGAVQAGLLGAITIITGSNFPE